MPQPSARSRLAQYEDGKAVGALAAIALVAFWPWLFAGKAFYWGDTGLYFLPMLRFLGVNLQEGTVPLWNPYLFCGTPFVGNPQASPFYPVAALLFVLPAAVYIMVVNVLHLWLAGVGLYFFLRRGYTALDFVPSLLGASTFLLGGYLVSKSQFPNMVQALAYVPWILLATERTIERPTVPRATFLGMVIGLQIMAAHAQISVLTFYLTLLYALVCFRWRQVRLSELRNILPMALLAVTIGLGLSCVYWLPVVDFVRFAERQQLSLAEANRFHLTLQELTNFFLPLRFGSPLSGNFGAPGNFWEKACYLGIMPLLLALFATTFAFTRHRDGHDHVAEREIRFWSAIFLLSVVLALGVGGGLYLSAYFLAPGIKHFHDPARMLLGAALAGPVLAALGLQKWQRRVNSRRLNFFVMACVLAVSIVDLAVHAHTIYPLRSVAEIEAMREVGIAGKLRADRDIARGQARVFFADPTKNRHKLLTYRTYFAEERTFLPHWSETVMPNLGMLFDIEQVGGYEPVAARTSKRRAAKAEVSLAGTKATGVERANALTELASMGAKYIVTYGARPLQAGPSLSLLGQSATEHRGYRAFLYLNRNFQPRARWVHLSSSRQQAVVTFAALTTQSPNMFEVVLPRSHFAPHLVLADSAHPGWHAYLDTRELQIMETEGGFRSVQAPRRAGDERLKFVYHPATFSLALFVTLVNGALVCAIAVFRLSKRISRTVAA